MQLLRRRPLRIRESGGGFFCLPFRQRKKVAAIAPRLRRNTPSQPAASGRQAMARLRADYFDRFGADYPGIRKLFNYRRMSFFVDRNRKIAIKTLAFCKKMRFLACIP